MLAMQNMPESQKKTTNKQKKTHTHTNKQTKKKSVTGTLESINNNLFHA